MRTRVGYAGGSKKNPTYRQLGDHMETVQIDFDPAQITYAKLLDVFWADHDPTRRSWSRQYMSAVFYHNQEQRRLAVAAKDRLASRLKKKIQTEILPYARFYRAEDYHQKYSLQSKRALMRKFRAIYSDFADFVDSTTAARLNGYLNGSVTWEVLTAELDEMAPAEKERMLDFYGTLKR